MFETSFKVDHEERLIDAALVGLIEVEAVASVIRDVREAAYVHGYPMVYDCSRADTSAVSVREAYELPRNHEIYQKRPEHRSGRVAVVLGPDSDLGFWSFYETTSYNAGLCVKIFHDRGKALSWLRLVREAP